MQMLRCGLGCGAEGGRAGWGWPEPRGAGQSLCGRPPPSGGEPCGLGLWLLQTQEAPACVSKMESMVLLP